MGGRLHPQHSMYCPPPTDWKPTRLIDIGPAPMASRFPGVVGYPRLVVMAEEEGAPTASYMTLSHHWGNGSPPILTLSNLKSMRSYIAPSLLPKTFQDAIEVTRDFGIRNL
jgi:hypothetical protein